MIYFNWLSIQAISAAAKAGGVQSGRCAAADAGGEQ
jgi:hypothetical protein